LRIRWENRLGESSDNGFLCLNLIYFCVLCLRSQSHLLCTFHLHPSESEPFGVAGQAKLVLPVRSPRRLASCPMKESPVQVTERRKFGSHTICRLPLTDTLPQPPLSTYSLLNLPTSVGRSCITSVVAIVACRSLGRSKLYAQPRLRILSTELPRDMVMRYPINFCPHIRCLFLFFSLVVALLYRPFSQHMVLLLSVQ
jgi:hypothetical protein